MANNFFLNQDPLLFNANEDYKKSYNELLNQYKMYQQQQSQMQVPQNTKDYIGDLDRLIKSLGDGTVETLSNNEEYVNLKNELMNMVQDELMLNIKWRLNNNQSAIRNIERQTDIINGVTKKVEEEQRKNLNELNDYVKNYSNMTFDEYKKMKNKDGNESKRIQGQDSRKT